MNHRLLYSVSVNADTDPMEFPVGIHDQVAAANEAAVLASRLAFVEAPEAAARLR